MRKLLTGGTGRLGLELQKLIPNIIAPSRAELDITKPDSVMGALERYEPELIIHAAAYTDVKGAETARAACWQSNVVGTRNLVSALDGQRLIHISTDYVFFGDEGNYHEDDPVGPVRNYYALSKLVAEEIARCAKHHLVIRTSFRPSRWPHPLAFDDVYTSQDYVDIIAADLALVIRNVDSIPANTLHIATERKSVFELARRRNPKVRAGSKADAGVDLPDDISLNTECWQQLKVKLLAQEEKICYLNRR